MNVAQSNFVILDANTDNPRAIYKGQEVPGLKAINLDTERKRVVVTVAEDPLLAEMQADNIIIRRVWA